MFLGLGLVLFFGFTWGWIFQDGRIDRDMMELGRFRLALDFLLSSSCLWVWYLGSRMARLIYVRHISNGIDPSPNPALIVCISKQAYYTSPQLSTFQS